MLISISCRTITQIIFRIWIRVNTCQKQGPEQTKRNGNHKSLLKSNPTGNIARLRQRVLVLPVCLRYFQAHLDSEQSALCLASVTVPQIFKKKYTFLKKEMFNRSRFYSRNKKIRIQSVRVWPVFLPLFSFLSF